MKYYYDKGAQGIPFKVRDKVLLLLKDYQKTKKALYPKFKEPFEIIQKISLVTFKLKLLAHYYSIYLIFHASKLALYTNLIITRQKPSLPQPVKIKSFEKWEVGKILQHEKRGHRVKFLVQ